MRNCSLFPPTILLALIVFNTSCGGEVEINNIRTAPAVSEADEGYANVFKPLDGKWKGEFKILEDLSVSPKAVNAYENLGVEHLHKPTLRLSSVIAVEQRYSSESPYFQRVRLRETPTTEAGEQPTISSTGVRKVQDGELWYVVQKPDETIIHRGKQNGQNTFLWQRKEQNPQRIERFQETITDDVYQIIGYGYYEGDDTTKTPKYWYYGHYERQ